MTLRCVKCGTIMCKDGRPLSNCKICGSTMAVDGDSFAQCDTCKNLYVAFDYNVCPYCLGDRQLASIIKQTWGYHTSGTKTQERKNLFQYIVRLGEVLNHVTTPRNFHEVHKKCGGPIVYRTYDEVTGMGEDYGDFEDEPYCTKCNQFIDSDELGKRFK